MNMKRFSYFLAMFAMLLEGCKRETIDISSLVAERDSIKEVSIRQQQELDNLNAFVGTVSNGLDSIARQENLIRLGNPEGGRLSRAQLKQSLEELAQLLARHRARITVLEDSLRSKKAGTEHLHGIIAYLNEQLESKEKVISQLRAELNTKNIDIDRLQTTIVELTENVEKLDRKTQIQHQALITQSDMMNECYMKIGTKKQLKQAGITDGKRLIAESLRPENFVRVDIRQFRELTLNCKKPKILTTMPPSAYTIVRNSDGTSLLTIKDPTAFWSSSNYLVISLE